VTFANPAGNAAAAAAEYVRALLEFLGDRDPLAVAAEQVPWLERRLSGVSDAALRTAEAPGKWSAIEILQHLADTELVYAVRTRLVLTEDRPPLQGFDQDAWARALGYAEAPLELALAQLRATRTANLRLWRSLSAEQRARVGLHSERGPESLDLLIRLMGAHDLVHRRQLDRVLSAAGSGSAR
jgi:DinB family protein